MVKYGRVSGWHECLIRTRPALNAWKFAHTLDELVGTGWRIAGFAGLLAHEPNRVHVRAATEETAEECNLVGR